MKKTVLLAVLIALNSVSIAQNKPEKVSGTFKMKIESYMSDDQAKFVSLEQARLQAMADEFGTKISQSTSSRIESSNQSGTNTRFSSIANSFVNGIWLDDSKDPEFQFFTAGDERWIACTVQGNAKRTTKKDIDFIAKPLSCPEPGCVKQDFKNREQFYFYFRSPIAGFLSLYVDDESNCQMILPYQSMKSSTFIIEPDKDYIFFSPKHNHTGNASDTDPIEWFTNDESEIDLLYVIFSTQEFYKPNVKDDDRAYQNTTNLARGTYRDFPKFTSSKEFRKWLNENLTVNDNMFLEVVDISISK
jgi:hypothetical protein